MTRLLTSKSCLFSLARLTFWEKRERNKNVTSQRKTDTHFKTLIAFSNTCNGPGEKRLELKN
jgi:hypothetical protein